jgi:hypothetical protein
MTVILSDNSHHSSLRPFYVTAGSATLLHIPVCHEWGSTGFSSLCFCSFMFLLTIFKEGAGNVFFQLAGMRQI